MKVIVAAAAWSLNGINVYSTNLVRELCRMGVDARIIITQPDAPDNKPMARPDDLPIESLDFSAHGKPRKQREAMAAWLDDQAPCVYLPNNDYELGCAAPLVTDQVVIVGIAHSDDPEHYDHVRRVGRYWNWTVAVSESLAAEVAADTPAVADRISKICYGVDTPESPPDRSFGDNQPLSIIYAGRLVNGQKLIFDIPPIMQQLVDAGVPAHLDVYGGGKDQAEFVARCGDLIDTGVIRMHGIVTNEVVKEKLCEADVFLLTSAFEGLPVTLLEAMGRGCIPVVTDIRSGIPQVVRQDETGYRLPLGDHTAFADTLKRLHADGALRKRLAIAGHRTIVDEGYRLQDMASGYLKLFEQLTAEVEQGKYRRPPGRIRPPRDLTPRRWQDRLPGPLQAAGGAVKRFIKPATGT